MTASDELSRADEKSLGVLRAPSAKNVESGRRFHTWFGKVRKQGHGTLHNGAAVPVLTGGISCKRMTKRASGFCSDFPKFYVVDGVVVLGLKVEPEYQPLCGEQRSVSRFL